MVKENLYKITTPTTAFITFEEKEGVDMAIRWKKDPIIEILPK
jgi:hypothetical protein